MPPVPVMPVPVARDADPARTVMRPDHPAAMMVIGIGDGIVAAMEESAVMDTRETNATTMMEAHCATVPAATMPAATAVKAATMKTTVTAAVATSVSASMTTTNLDQSLTCSLRR